jgi:ubiquinone/menaquinone biosynthesis C-methylase UbiE
MSRATFWNIIAKKYARDPVADQPSYERKLAMTRAILTPDMHLLEVGCGTGTTALYHAPYVARIDAVDFSKAMIEIAREKARNQSITNVTFKVAALADLSSPARGYGAVLGLSFLHLLGDPVAGLKALTAQAKTGGYVITSTVCLGDMRSIVARIVPWVGMTGLIPKVAPLTRGALLAAHEKAGLEIVDEFRPGPEKSVFLIARKRGQSPA